MLPLQAWQPFTPRGVAAFAAARVGRLWLVQLLVAGVCATVVVWFVSADWLPVVRQAVGRLPPGACVRAGRLEWTAATPMRLAENRFLALVVDAKDAGTEGRVADLELVLHQTHLALGSLLGDVPVAYPSRGWSVSLDLATAAPWWGAWESPLLVMLWIGVVLGLMATWFVLATLYSPFVWAFGFFANRRLGWGAGWKLGGAALMPGAAVLVAGLVGYGALGLDLIRLGVLFLLHVITGWVYLLVSPYFLPVVQEAKSDPANPFGEASGGGAAPSSKGQNPFASRQ